MLAFFMVLPSTLTLSTVWNTLLTMPLKPFGIGAHSNKGHRGVNPFRRVDPASLRAFRLDALAGRPYTPADHREGKPHMTPDRFVHDTACVDDGAVVGEGTRVWHFCHVMPGAVIGENCNLGQNVVLMPSTKIGNNVKIQNNVSIYTGVTIEDYVFCAPSCVFTNVFNPANPSDSPF